MLAAPPEGADRPDLVAVRLAGCGAHAARRPQRWRCVVGRGSGVGRRRLAPSAARAALVRRVEALATTGSPDAVRDGGARPPPRALIESALLVAEVDRLAQRAGVARRRCSERTSGPQRIGRRPDETGAKARARRSPRATNRQIASRLFISEKTASVHVSSILTKLGASDRQEAATLPGGRLEALGGDVANLVTTAPACERRLAP